MQDYTYSVFSIVAIAIHLIINFDLLAGRGAATRRAKSYRGFLIGILGVTSYTIRSSATQSYVPHERKGRFNGAFIMLTTAGSLLGELLAGIFTAFLSRII